MTTPWAGLSLSAVVATGNLKQLYPASASAGTGAGTMGCLIRCPMGGVVTNINIESDGTNGGDIEVWDIDGSDAGANVDSLDVITNAQLVAMLASGKARLMWSQSFAGSQVAPKVMAISMNFQHGIASRYSNAPAGVPTGTCNINLIVDGGVCKKSLA